MSLPPTPETNTPPAKAFGPPPELALKARAAALIAATHAANARRLAGARAHAAAIVAEVELANAEFLRLAQEQAALLRASAAESSPIQAQPSPAPAPRPEPEPVATPAAQLEPEPEAAAPVVEPTAQEPAKPPALAPVGEPASLVRLHAERAQRLPAERESLASIDGGVDLIAGPFARFSQLAAFTRSVRELPGVLSLNTREFLKGTVHLRLRYADPIPLAVRLTELTEFRPTLAAASPSRVELRVNPAEPTAEPAKPAEPGAPIRAIESVEHAA